MLYIHMYLLTAYCLAFFYVISSFWCDHQCWQHWWQLLPSFFGSFPPPLPSSCLFSYFFWSISLRCFLNHAYKYATQFFSITTRWQFTFGRGCRAHVLLPVFAFRFAIAIDNLCAERERERGRWKERGSLRGRGGGQEGRVSGATEQGASSIYIDAEGATNILTGIEIEYEMKWNWNRNEWNWIVA